MCRSLSLVRGSPQRPILRKWKGNVNKFKLKKCHKIQIEVTTGCWVSFFFSNFPPPPPPLQTKPLKSTTISGTQANTPKSNQQFVCGCTNTSPGVLYGGQCIAQVSFKSILKDHLVFSSSLYRGISMSQESTNPLFLDGQCKSHAPTMMNSESHPLTPMDSASHTH